MNVEALRAGPFLPDPPLNRISMPEHSIHSAESAMPGDSRANEDSTL
jgi:hypothetical protein